MGSSSSSRAPALSPDGRARSAAAARTTTRFRVRRVGSDPTAPGSSRSDCSPRSPGRPLAKAASTVNAGCHAGVLPSQSGGDGPPHPAGHARSACRQAHRAVFGRSSPGPGRTARCFRLPRKTRHRAAVPRSRNPSRAHPSRAHPTRPEPQLHYVRSTPHVHLAELREHARGRSGARAVAQAVGQAVGPVRGQARGVGAGGRGSPARRLRSERPAGAAPGQPTLQGRLVALSPPAPETTYPNVALWPGFNEPFQSALWTIADCPL